MNFEQFFTPYLAVKSLPGRVVAVLAPHPDDEVFGCGGVLNQLCVQGADVRVAIISNDMAGNVESSDYANVRMGESRQAADILGYKTPEFWGFPDGNLLDEVDLEKRIGDWLADLQPDLVLIPSIWEMHRDHRAVAVAALNCLHHLSRDCHIAMFEVGVPLTPNVLVDITQQLQLKSSAMQCFQSQLSQQAYAEQISGLNRFRTYSLNMDVESAEAFVLLTRDEAAQLTKDLNPEKHTLVVRAAEKHICLIEAQLQQASDELEQLRQKFNITVDQLDESHQHINNLRDELALTQKDLAKLEDNIKALLLSTSWRLTAPLRTLTGVLRGERSVKSVLKVAFRRAWYRLPIPNSIKYSCRALPETIQQYFHQSANSKSNHLAAQDLLNHRADFMSQSSALLPENIADVVELDVSVVTYNSSMLLEAFFNSLLTQAFPVKHINLIFVDNDSTDNTLDVLKKLRLQHQDAFASIGVISRPNDGFGAGHNAGINAGKAPFVLVVNPDIQFENHTLTKLLETALCGSENDACWESRQKPYEHPKLYDPITLETNWCSHACVLLRRSAMASIGGYDERIFLYGEDVEVSYRLREAGYTLRYVPSSTVWHFTYDSAGQIKPAQYIGSILGNFYLRTRYGTRTDMLFVLPLMASVFLRSPFKGSRRALVKGLFKRYFRYIPQLLKERKDSKSSYPFRLLDYEQQREGAFYEAKPVSYSSGLPLVSIITRTVAGREQLLKQAGFTVLNQTYPNIEWVVVEDGGEFQRAVVEDLAQKNGVRVHYEALNKVGRSAAGNQGMEIATGEWLMFLDDDDCLYADHVETLVAALYEDKKSVAAYSLAWEVESRIEKGGLCITEATYRQVPSLRQPFDYARLRECNYIPIQAIIFKANLFRERGGFDVNLDYLEDWHLWQRYAHGNQFIYVPKTTSMYRTPMDPADRAKRQMLLDDAYFDVKERTETAINAIDKHL